jgi:adenylosuccinate lyase
MIERYTLPAMHHLWSEPHKLTLWLQVELALAQASETHGLLPQGTHASMQAKAQLNPQRMAELETQLKHDTLAFLGMLSESLGDDLARHLHQGLTSSDMLDTALALRIKAATPLLMEALLALQHAVWQQANTHQHTAMVGRSHGVHGEPITFGFKLLGWVDELERHQTRLHEALMACQVGMFSGAMGTYAHLPPAVEATACQLLGLQPARISTQVVARDRLAALLSAFGLLAATVEKMAVELRHLQRTEVLEVEEAFSTGQKGSSAMPHKRNPISAENVSGLCRLLRSYVAPAMENTVLWHERDMSHSSVERVILPDAFSLLHYLLHRFANVVSQLQVYPHAMQRNLMAFGGILFSQKVMLALVKAGMEKDAAYRLVQHHAHTVWQQGATVGNFRQAIEADEHILGLLSPAEREACFDTAPFMAHITTVFNRFTPPQEVG